MIIKDISVMIAGKAGDGVLFTGNVLAKILKRVGWEVVTYRDFPSNIRGEPTNYTIRASIREIHGRGDSVNVLLAFDCEAVTAHAKSLASGGIVFCDGEDTLRLSPKLRREKTFHKFPVRNLAREKFKNEIFKNMIALGGLSYILDLDFKVIERVIREAFLASKGKEIVDKNIRALNLGWTEAQKIIGQRGRHPLRKKKDQGKLLMSGDEAIAVGALASGCRFFAAYPICPASEIWEWLNHHYPEFNGLVVQTEDELSAINMALGASYAGMRSMTSTSGPGASLMMEGFSLAGMTEIPLVVAHVQRVGPSTGLPTKNEQSDLLQWIYGSHGDFPRIVLSPGTIQECFEFTAKAFNLAEKYQCPVILMTEQDYGQNYRTVKRFRLNRVKIDRGKLLTKEELSRIQDYRRFRFTRDGISPRALPGMKGGRHTVESTEHDEHGFRNEDPEIRTRMMDKRLKKLRTACRDLFPPLTWGDEKSMVGLIGCGSTFGPIQEAVEQLAEMGLGSKHLQIRTLWPFFTEDVRTFVSSCRQVFVVENNATGQLASLVESQVHPKTQMHKVLKYSGQSFMPLEITRQVEETVR